MINASSPSRVGCLLLLLHACILMLPSGEWYLETAVTQSFSMQQHDLEIYIYMARSFSSL
jgi:hypothetical protein